MLLPGNLIEPVLLQTRRGDRCGESAWLRRQLVEDGPGISPRLFYEVLGRRCAVPGRMMVRALERIQGRLLAVTTAADRVRSSWRRRLVGFIAATRSGLNVGGAALALFTGLAAVSSWRCGGRISTSRSVRHGARVGLRGRVRHAEDGSGLSPDAAVRGCGRAGRIGIGPCVRQTRILRAVPHQGESRDRAFRCRPRRSRSPS